MEERLCDNTTDERDGRVHNANAEKMVGHDSYPVNEFSIAVSKIKGALPLLHDFIKEFCIKGKVIACMLTYRGNVFTLGVASTEVGKRAHNLHLQAVIKVHYPKAKAYVTLLAKTIKGCLPGSGVGYRVVVKPFVGAQNFSSMVGYCKKDTGRSHFKLLLHNVEPGVNMHFDNAVSLFNYLTVLTIGGFSWTARL